MRATHRGYVGSVQLRRGPIAGSRELSVPAGDTHLAVQDTPGGTPPVLLLGGGFGTIRDWDPVVQRLAGRHRAVRFDARARGRSGTSSDYSVQAAVDDVGRVIEATHLERPVVVGWSYGATLAVRHAARNPAAPGGLVLVDGAYPIAMFDEAGKEKVRAQFRRLGPMMRVLAWLGRSAHMSPAESAAVVIEMDEVNGRLGPDFAALQCPTLFVVGTGAHAGATESEMQRLRASVAEAEATNPRVSVFAVVPHKHTQILAKSPDAVVGAIEAVVERAG